MRYSKQREALLSVLRSTSTHPTANEIYEMVHKIDPKISRGTVYRNLGLLTSSGTVLKIDTVHDSAHYDGCTDEHYHFVCNKCGSVSDLSISPINIDKSVENDLDCKVSTHSLIFYGECKKCKNV